MDKLFWGVMNGKYQLKRMCNSIMLHNMGFTIQACGKVKKRFNL